MISLNGARSGPAISTIPFRGAASATSATMAATSSAAMGWNRPGEILTVFPSVTWGGSGQGGRIRVTSADLQYLFGIQRSEPDCMTRLVSEHDQPHIRSPRETAAPISRLRRSGLRKTRPFLKTGFLGHVRMRFVHLGPPGLIKA